MPDNKLLTPTVIGGKKMGKATGRQKAKMQKVMHEFKAKELHSGSRKGPIVTDPAQAIAIGMSEAEMPKPKTRKKKAAR